MNTDRCDLPSKLKAQNSSSLILITATLNNFTDCLTPMVDQLQANPTISYLFTDHLLEPLCGLNNHSVFIVVFSDRKYCH